jgi:hypothetical protein
MDIPDHFHFRLIDSFGVFAGFFYRILCLSKIFHHGGFLTAYLLNLDFHLGRHLLCQTLMIFVGLLAGLLSQFAEFLANLGLAKLLLVGPIFEGSLRVIVAGFEETKIFIDPSHSGSEGISFVLSINS